MTRGRGAAALVFALALGALAGACERAAAKRQRRVSEVQDGMKRLITARLAEWDAAVAALQAAAPVSAGRGWDARLDARALDEMRAAWTRGRIAYERVEGAVAPLFPESDVATDARYEMFLAAALGTGDPSPFDGEGVVGMHAIERILWADAVPAEVSAFERALAGYRAPAFPATEAEARAFKRDLVGRVVADVRQLGRDLGPVELDVAFAFRGLIDLALEQKEKVDKAATGEEESRYAQATMRDLRANMQGCREAYDVFRPWVLATTGGPAVDAKVAAAFARLEAAYRAIAGDAIPRPPATWSALEPSPTDRATPFGILFTAVERESNPELPGGLVASLGEVADVLPLPRALLR
jgi:iron uptake system component EfeO